MPYQDDLRRYFGEIARYAEPALTAGSAAIAEPVSGLAGLGALLRGRGVDGASQSINAAQQAMTYQPRTMEGRQGLQGLQAFLQPVGEVIQGASQNLGDKAYSATGSPALAAAAYSAPTAFLEGLGLKGLNIARKPVSGADLYTPRIFAGVKAKTADLAALDRAKALEAAGASRDQIWTETGWLNDGGDWKFEISDKDAALANPTESSAAGVMSHGSLFDAYPELRNVSVSHSKSPSSAYNSETGEVILGAYDKVSSLLHELQHAIQEKEGFNLGGNPNIKGLPTNDYYIKKINDEFSNMKSAITNSDEYKSIYSERLDSILSDKKTVEGIKSDIRKENRRGYIVTDDDVIMEARKIAKKAAADDSGISKLENDVNKRINEILLMGHHGNVEGYKRLGGEVEARKVQARIPLTADERKGRAPWLDTDVPENEIIPYKK